MLAWLRFELSFSAVSSRLSNWCEQAKKKVRQTTMSGNKGNFQVVKHKVQGKTFEVLVKPDTVEVLVVADRAPLSLLLLLHTSVSLGLSRGQELTG